MRDAARAVSGWAGAVPLLCAAHCAASPLLVLAAPALALSEAGEAWVKAVSALVAAAVVGVGVRAHRRASVLVPVAAGIALWAAVVALDAHGAAGRLAAAAGGVLLAGGMFWNAHLRHRATCRACANGAQVTVTEIAGEV